jgi:hypothetical protein
MCFFDARQREDEYCCSGDPPTFSTAVVQGLRAGLVSKKRTIPLILRPARPIYFFLGTFFPFLRALERAMAMACFRLFTLPAFPALPLFAFPRL